MKVNYYPNAPRILFIVVTATYNLSLENLFSVERFVLYLTANPQYAVSALYTT